jgi:hypothetical protein
VFHSPDRDHGVGEFEFVAPTYQVGPLPISEDTEPDVNFADSH